MKLSILFSLLLLLSCQQRSEDSSQAVEAVVQDQFVHFETDHRFASIAIDTSLIIGGRWWDESGKFKSTKGARKIAPINLYDQKLIDYARELSPAYLRIGGTEADFTGVSFPQKKGEFENWLDYQIWQGVHHFIEQANFDLMFTLNAGPGVRVDSGDWSALQLSPLIQDLKKNQRSVAVWELGNEVNAFWVMHGPFSQISGEQYFQDYQKVKSFLAKEGIQAKVAGPAAAYWPYLGEPIAFLFGLMEDFIRAQKDAIDIITWHFYPTQSRRCPVASRRSSREKSLSPKVFDEVKIWAKKILKLRDTYQPGAKIWLGESGHAQCGGEPGLSDSFYSSLWWLDQLGILAKLQHDVVVRQSLIGSNYGLIERKTLNPRPDYYATWLWKKLMGNKVLAVDQRHKNSFVRLYAHCHPKRKNTLALLAINLKEESSKLLLEQFGGDFVQHYSLNSTSKDMKEISLNGKRIEGLSDFKKEFLQTKATPFKKEVHLAAKSINFFVSTSEKHRACQEISGVGRSFGRGTPHKSQLTSPLDEV